MFGVVESLKLFIVLQFKSEMIGPDAPEQIIPIKHKIINKISNFSLR